MKNIGTKRLIGYETRWQNVNVLLASRKSLIKALEFNPWCAIYLTLIEEMSRQQSPESYSPGSREEARLFLDYQSHAWAGNPAALYWLVLTGLPWLLENGFESELEQAFG